MQINHDLVIFVYCYVLIELRVLKEPLHEADGFKMLKTLIETLSLTLLTFEFFLMSRFWFEVHLLGFKIRIRRLGFVLLYILNWLNVATGF
jgi:hypothetical protein